jgi:hypothetical protein
VTFPLFIVQLEHARELRVLAAVAFCFGILVVIFGLLARRRQAKPSNRNPALVTRTVPPRLFTDSATPGVVRLSSSSGPARSTEMSQQERIAAALTRAGVSISAPWTQNSAIGVDTSDELANRPISPTPLPASPTFYNANLLLWCGVAISIASVCLLIFAR